VGSSGEHQPGPLSEKEHRQTEHRRRANEPSPRRQQRQRVQGIHDRLGDGSGGVFGFLRPATRATETDEQERERLSARTYQWLTASQRRRLEVLDARAVVARYPWLARAEASRHAQKELPGKNAAGRVR
jgi:hypothetical protein